MYASQNAGDFVTASAPSGAPPPPPPGGAPPVPGQAPPLPGQAAPGIPVEDDLDGEFSGSDDEEREEWERRKRERAGTR